MSDPANYDRTPEVKMRSRTEAIEAMAGDGKMPDGWTIGEPRFVNIGSSLPQGGVWEVQADCWQDDKIIDTLIGRGINRRDAIASINADITEWEKARDKNTGPEWTVGEPRWIPDVWIVDADAHKDGTYVTTLKASADTAAEVLRKIQRMIDEWTPPPEKPYKVEYDPIVFFCYDDEIGWHYRCSMSQVAGTGPDYGYEEFTGTGTSARRAIKAAERVVKEAYKKGKPNKSP